MKALKAIVIAGAVVAFLWAQGPHSGWADGKTGTGAEHPGITQNDPRILTSGEIKLPMTTRAKVFWGILAAALIAGVAAGASGGGGGSSDSPGSSGGADSGGITVGW